MQFEQVLEDEHLYKSQFIKNFVNLFKVKISNSFFSLIERWPLFFLGGLFVPLTQLIMSVKS